MATLQDLKRMGMILCPFCGNATPKKLKACKHCNHILPQRNLISGLLWLGLALFLISQFGPLWLKLFGDLLR